MPSSAKAKKMGANRYTMALVQLNTIAELELKWMAENTSVNRTKMNHLSSKRDCNRLFPQSSALLLFLQPYHSSVYQLLETKTSWTFFFAVPTDAILRRQHRFYSNNVIISSKMFQKPCNSQQKWQLGFYAWKSWKLTVSSGKYLKDTEFLRVLFHMLYKQMHKQHKILTSQYTNIVDTLDKIVNLLKPS